MLEESVYFIPLKNQTLDTLIESLEKKNYWGMEFTSTAIEEALDFKLIEVTLHMSRWARVSCYDLWWVLLYIFLFMEVGWHGLAVSKNFSMLLF